MQAREPRVQCPPQQTGWRGQDSSSNSLRDTFWPAHCSRQVTPCCHACLIAQYLQRAPECLHPVCFGLGRGAIVSVKASGYKLGIFVFNMSLHVFRSWCLPGRQMRPACSC